MLFNSYVFLFLFLPITLAIYFVAGRRSHRLAIAWMALASLGFYAWWNPPYILLLLASVLFNYGAGQALIRAPNPASRRGLLAVAVVADLALLGYFKYANFFLDSARALFDTNWDVGAIILPLGISFFTFTQITFLVDTARGQVKEVDFTRYLLFVTYFPHLIAGPILHHAEMMPQFARPDIARFSSRRMALGLSIFTVGLLKKVVLADSIAVHASPMFEAAAHGGHFTAVESWSGALAYTLQLYFDFSGYSDMAIGLARMIGVRLPLNFNSPYKSASIIEFWRRWHMTLSRFLRDYVYFSLGGNRRGPSRRYVNLMLTMLLGGLWHGAGWTFVLWGALHGFYLLINHAWIAVAGVPATPSRARRVGAALLTFLAVVVAWVLFRAPSLGAAMNVLAGMVGVHGVWPADMTKAQSATLAAGWGWVVGLLAIVWLLPNTQEIFARYRLELRRHPWPNVLPLPILGVRWRLTTGWACLLALGAVVAVVRLTRPSEFIYFQF